MTSRSPKWFPLHWQQYLLCAAAVVLFSEVSLNYHFPVFRLSTSVILLPVLFLTLVQGSPAIAGIVTGLSVLLFRTALSFFSAVPFPTAVTKHLAAAVFYVCYGFMFAVLLRERSSPVPQPHMVMVFALCDFVSNLVEIFVDIALRYAVFSSSLIFFLLFAAVLRAAGAAVLLMLYCQYHALLTHAEHEERYQRLYLMKTRLRSELYFLAKDKVRIEDSVKVAYQLYEQLSKNPAVPKETSQMALQVACDVHDIKKDYIRIESGFHEELGSNTGERSMPFSGVVQILEDSTRRMLADSPGIEISFSCKNDFVTVEHYTLMSVLRCLVNNSIEAIQAVGQTKALVELHEWKEADTYCMTVSDNGPGISQKHMDSIFQMGFSTKFDEATGNIYRGMGLPNVKLSVEEHLGGTVSVHSTPGVRTEFEIILPAAILEVPQ